MAETLGRLIDAGSGQVLFQNSGAEANEAALKLVRKFQGRGRHGVVSALRSFHGRTLMALAATGQPEKHEPFQPLPGGVPARGVERPRRVRTRPDARGRRRDPRADPGRRRCQRRPTTTTSVASGRSATSAESAADLRRDPDRDGPHRRLVRVSAFRHHGPTSSPWPRASPTACRWARSGLATRSPRRSGPAITARPTPVSRLALSAAAGHARRARTHRRARVSPDRPRCDAAVGCSRRCRVSLTSAAEGLLLGAELTPEALGGAPAARSPAHASTGGWWSTGSPRPRLRLTPPFIITDDQIERGGRHHRRRARRRN